MNSIDEYIGQSDVKDKIDYNIKNEPGKPLPGAKESHTEFLKRIQKVLKPNGEIEKDYPNKKIIVVTHHQVEVLHANNFSKTTDAMFKKGIEPGTFRKVKKTYDGKGGPFDAIGNLGTSLWGGIKNVLTNSNTFTYQAPDSTSSVSTPTPSTPSSIISKIPTPSSVIPKTPIIQQSIPKTFTPPFVTPKQQKLATSTPQNTIEGYNFDGFSTNPNWFKLMTQIYSQMQDVSTTENAQKEIDRVASTSPITGKMVIKTSQKYGMTPKLLLTLLRGESGLGVSPRATTTNNPGSILLLDNGLNQNYTSTQEGVNALGREVLRRKTQTP